VGQATDTDGTLIGVSGGCRVTHHTMTAATATATSRITVMIIKARVERGTGLETTEAGFHLFPHNAATGARFGRFRPRLSAQGPRPSL
jgi:hypothetical protein